MLSFVSWRWNLTGWSQKLGGFDDAIRISPYGDDGSIGMPPLPKTEAEDLQHHLAPCVLHNTTTACCNSDFPMLRKRNQGGVALRLFLGSMVSRYLDSLDAGSIKGTFSPGASPPSLRRN